MSTGKAIACFVFALLLVVHYGSSAALTSEQFDGDPINAMGKPLKSIADFNVDAVCDFTIVINVKNGIVKGVQFIIQGADSFEKMKKFIASRYEKLLKESDYNIDDPNMKVWRLNINNEVIVLQLTKTVDGSTFVILHLPVS